MGQTDGAQRDPLRVVYVPPVGAGRGIRVGSLVTISRPSGLVQFDDCSCPQWARSNGAQRAPDRVEVGTAGWGQLMLWAEGGG